MNLNLDIQQDNDCAIIRINGIMDISTMDVFLNQLEKLPEVASIILDFSNLEFIDSTGIGAIMEIIYLSQEKNFSVDLQGMDESTRQIFEVVGLFTVLRALQKEGA